MSEAQLPVGHAEKGKKLFVQRCAMCHSVEKVNKQGPSLSGLFGRQTGSINGYRYTAANSSKGRRLIII